MEASIAIIAAKMQGYDWSKQMTIIDQNLWQNPTYLHDKSLRESMARGNIPQQNKIYLRKQQLESA